MRIEARLETHPQADRRGTPRRELRLQLDSLAANNKRSNVTVLDISQTGMLMQTSSRLSPGDSLQIELPEAGPQAAEVIWTSGEFVGCRFAEPLSSAALSAARLRSEPADAVGERPDASRESETFGARLRRLRQHHDLTQAALARLLNVTKLSVWKWERGHARPRQAALEALGRTFAVSPSELLLGHAAAAATQPQEISDVIDECKDRIASHLGTTSDKVEITVKL